MLRKPRSRPERRRAGDTNERKCAEGAVPWPPTLARLRTNRRFPLKGIGEIGIVGMNAAIANAVWHATGKRILELSIRVESSVKRQQP
jgi:hypothetical protein